MCQCIAGENLTFLPRGIYFLSFCLFIPLYIRYNVLVKISAVVNILVTAYHMGESFQD